MIYVDEVLAVARSGVEAGCTEALFTLGDKPELRYRVAREELDELGYDSTISYLADMAGLVLRETGLLPHLNPGTMTEADIAMLRPVSVSMGLMLEGLSPSLSARGGPRWIVRQGSCQRLRRSGPPVRRGCPSRLAYYRYRRDVDERRAALGAIRDLHDKYGHIQEIIIQNFRAKPGTRMADAPEPDLESLMQTVADARGNLGQACRSRPLPI